MQTYTGPRRSRRVLAIAVAAVLAATATACSSSGNGSGTDGSPAVSPSASPSSTSGSPQLTPTVQSPTALAPTGAPDNTGGAVATCKQGQVAITGQDLGSASQEHYAKLIFTNSSQQTCALSGYPTVELYADGKAVGSGRQSAGTVDRVTLQPGKAVSSRIVASTACDAPLSDEVKVTLPDMTQRQVIALEIRACSFSVAPLA